MKKKLLIWIMSGFAVMSLCSCKEKQNVIMNRDDTCFSIEFSNFDNDVCEHTIFLEAGDSLQCDIAVDAGILDVVIKSDAETLYTGKDTPDGSFELPVSASGNYSISVVGEDADGAVMFERVPAAKK